MRSRNLGLFVTVALGLLAAALAAEAQPRAKLARVGVLTPGAVHDKNLDAFRQNDAGFWMPQA